MKNLIDLSSQIKRRMTTVLCLLTVIALLASPLPRSLAQNSTDRDQKGQAIIEAPAGGDAPLATFPGIGVGAIPDGLSGTPPVYGAPLVISFAVSGVTAPLTSVSVDLTLTHTWVGDLDMVLASPAGTASLVTVSRIGVTTAGSFGDNSNYNGTYNFTDAAAGANIWTVATAAACGDTCDVTAGDYRTTAGGTAGQTNPPPVTSLNTTFGGLTTAQINGPWTLTIRDAAAADTGSVTAANLKLTPAAAVPELLYATSGNDIASFNNTATGVVTSVPVTGMQAGESLIGIDVRPRNSKLYGVGSSSRLYTIDPLTGAATQVGAAGQFTLSGTSFAMDFNPNVDRIRIISNTGQNLRLNPDTGGLAATDTSITPAGVTITGAAYDRNDLDPLTLTTLYAIDSTNGVLTTVGSVNGSPNSPNGGVVGPTVGSLGLGTGLDPRIGLDISATSAIGFATMLTGGTDKLYQINLSTGAATLVGTIGTGTTVYSGLTVAKAPLAGEISLSGRVTSGGRGITNAKIMVSGGSLSQPKIAVTGRNGTYVIDGLTAGETYLVTVSARRFTFEDASRVITLNDNLTGVDFVAIHGIR